MNKALALVLVIPLAALAAPAPRKCASGAAPRLSGDAFSPVECSTATAKAAPALPGQPVVPGEGKAPTLKELEGRWEASLTHALGRYELLLTVKTRWGGKADMVLAMKELQFRDRNTDRLALVPVKGVRGAWEAEMTTDLAPAAAPLKGRLTMAGTEEERQLDLSFENGAAHRVWLKRAGKDEWLLRAASAIPGAAVQKFETRLLRTKRDAL